MAKKAKEKVLRFKESELCGLLENEHERGYKEGLRHGVADGRDLQRSVDAPMLVECRELRAESQQKTAVVDMLTAIAAAIRGA